jgi:hypothetical protein
LSSDEKIDEERIAAARRRCQKNYGEFYDLLQKEARLQILPAGYRFTREVAKRDAEFLKSESELDTEEETKKRLLEDAEKEVEKEKKRIARKRKAEEEELEFEKNRRTDLLELTKATIDRRERAKEREVKRRRFDTQ